MKSFENNKLEKFRISHDILSTVKNIGQYQGKEDFYKNQSPQVLANLKQHAAIQSIESSNRIEGVAIPHAERFKKLLQKDEAPRNRSEQEIAGYRDVLKIIHDSYDSMPFGSGLVLQLHRDLFQFTNDQGGKWKQIDNSITETYADGSSVVRFQPLPAWQTGEAMNQLHIEFEKTKLDALIAIPAYILDFLCIHPFKDGNGRISRVLSLLLLYKFGYGVGRYISLERIVENTKESYYRALHASSQGWHNGTHNLTPWIEYFLGVMLLGAYRDFEGRVSMVEVTKGAKAAMILDAINKLPNQFTISDLVSQCPTVGIDHIRKTLKNESKKGNLKSEGRGPRAYWVKCS